MAGSDTGQSGDGLFLDRGGKTWVWRGRINGRSVRKIITHKETGDRATIASMTKTEARSRAKAMSADAANGGMKFFAHIDAKPKAGDWTVAQAWTAYMEREGSTKRDRTATRKRSNYRRFIEPRWHDKPIRAITTDDCLRLLADVRQDYESKGQQGTTVNTLRSDLGAFFSWALTRYELGVKSNPMRDVPRQVRETPKPPRALDEVELRWFFLASTSIGGRSAEATEFLLRAALRRDETFEARWGWLRDDGLLVPAEKAKNGYAMLVPLTDAMRALIGERPAEAGDDERIFRGADPRTLGDIRAAMTRLAKINGDFNDNSDPRHFTLHNLRDTFMTLMEDPSNEYDQPLFPMETRDAVLNHRPSGVGSKHYNASLRKPRWFYAQRKGALRYWNELLDRLKAEALVQREAA